MPKPKPNENRAQFLDRCIPVVVNEGTDREQAVAICISMWRDESKSRMTWKSIDSKRWGYLGYATNLFTKAIRQQAKPALEAKDFNFRLDVDETPVRNAFRQLYRRVMQNFGEDTLSRLKAEHDIKVTKTGINWESVINAWLSRNTVDLIQNISNTTRNAVDRVLTQAIQEGLSIDDFARMLDNDYGLSRNRGRLIGRTEIIRASNYGSLLGAQEAGLSLKKGWLSSRDARVRGLQPNDRYDHVNADGQFVGLEGQFLVSGEAMDVPCDPQASPGNTINCRCTIIYERLGSNEIIVSGNKPLPNVEWTTNRPDNLRKMKKVIEDEGYDVVIQSLGRGKSMVPAMASPSQKKIFLNKRGKFFLDPNKTMKEQFDNGWWSSDNPLGIAYHEIAHLKFAQKDNFFSLSHRDIVERVSRYARVNPKEFVSEVYSGVKTGKKYDDEIINLYNRYRGA